jgi:hypothetical protein
VVTVQASDFFSGIEHPEVPWGERTIRVPIFYRAATSMGVLVAASLRRVQALLPSSRMHPVRLTPWHGVLSVSTMEFKDSDLGPYNEVSIGIPFSLDSTVLPFAVFLGRRSEDLHLYIHRLPVTTEVARAAGVEFAGYPKFLARIEFEHNTEWVTCRLVESDRPILTLSGRKVDLRDSPRSRWQVFTARNGRLLRSELILSERRMGASRRASDIRLELGDHPIAEELRGLKLGRMLMYEYVPAYQCILTPVIESFTV